MTKINGIWTNDSSDINEVKNPGKPVAKPKYTGKGFDYLDVTYRANYKPPIGVGRLK